jgi:hypothetical protein
MQTYFFHLRDGVDVLLDPEGRLLPSIEAVAAAAMREARALISAEAKNGKISLISYIDVEDQQGKVIHTLSFEDAVKVERR